jgi:hypothetical protein
MAGIEFKFSSRDLIALRKWYKKSPRQFAASTGMLLNNMAFGSKAASFELLDRRMILRNRGFVKSSLGVKKSHFREPIATQRSQYGSRQRARFTGWIEQELGPKKKRTHYASTPGRGGKRSGRIRRKWRLDQPFVNPSKYPKRRGFKGRNRDHRVQVMLRTLDKMKYSAPFIIRGHTRIPAGLYKFTRGRTGHDQRNIQLLQAFGKPRKPTKRVRWMRGGVKLYFSRTNIKREWGKVVERMLRRQGPR